MSIKAWKKLQAYEAERRAAETSKRALKRVRRNKRRRQREAVKLFDADRYPALDLRETFDRAWPVGDHRPVYIYALVDPKDATVRYVGKTVDRERRDAEHLANRWQRNPDLAKWIRRRSRHLGIEVHHLDVVGEPHWAEAERAWIAFFRAHGRLYNIEDGGPSRKHAR